MHDNVWNEKGNDFVPCARGTRPNRSVDSSFVSVVIYKWREKYGYEDNEFCFILLYIYNHNNTCRSILLILFLESEFLISFMRNKREEARRLFNYSLDGIKIANCFERYDKRLACLIAGCFPSTIQLSTTVNHTHHEFL